MYFYTTVNPNFILFCHLLQFLGNLKYHILMHYSKFYLINRIGRFMESWVEPRPCWMTIQLIVAHKFQWSQIISFKPLIDGTFHVVPFRDIPFYIALLISYHILINLICCLQHLWYVKKTVYFTLPQHNSDFSGDLQNRIWSHPNTKCTHSQRDMQFRTKNIPPVFHQCLVGIQQ